MNRCIQCLVLLLSLAALKVSAQGTAFNYQGRLNDTGSPASGTYDFRFTVYDAVTNGTADTLPITNSAVAVSSGQFSVTLDFGAGLFTGNNYWLDIGVRTNGSTNFISLFPRQPIRPVPYAIFATGASNLIGTLAATQITGTLPSAQISGTYSGAVNFVNNTNTFSGTYTGNGAALTNLNATQLTAGTVADARLSSNVALLNASQTFTGNNNFNGGNNFTNRANNFTGSFFGNGLVGWVVITNTAVTALADTGYLLTSSLFTTVTLPTGTNLLVGDIVRVSGAGAGGWRVGQGTNQSIIGNFVSYKNSVWTASSASSGTWNCLASSADGAVMYAGMKSTSGIFSSTDYGHTWSATAATGTGWYGLACSADGNKVYGVPSGGNIQYSTNAGLTWSSVANSKLSWVAVACSADGSKAFAAVKAGALYLTTNSGAVWNIVGTGIPNSGIANWSSVAASADGTHLAAAISGNTIYTSTNTGANWSGGAPVAFWSDVVMSSDGLKLAATINNNSIYTSTNSGTTWSNAAVPIAAWSCLAASADCTRLVAGISNGVIYASLNFGATWSPLVGAPSKPWSALTSSANGDHLVGAVNASSGNLYYSGSAAQITSLTGTNGFLTGSQGSAVELQYIGNNQFMPVSAVGTLWAN